MFIDSDTRLCLKRHKPQKKNLNIFLLSSQNKSQRTRTQKFPPQQSADNEPEKFGVTNRFDLLKIHDNDENEE
jgi:hypothetical protein